MSSSTSRSASSAVGRIHLVAAPVAELRCRFGGIAEGPVERSGELRGVAENRRVREVGVVQRAADRAHAPVHHVARRHDVGPGARRARRPRAPAIRASRHCPRHRRAVTPQWPWSVYSHMHTSVITTRSGSSRLSARTASLYRAGLIPGARAGRVLVLGNAEQQHASHPGLGGRGGVADQLVHRELEVAGHGCDRHAHLPAGAHEHREYELGCRRDASREPGGAATACGGAAADDTRGSWPLITLGAGASANRGPAPSCVESTRVAATADSVPAAAPRESRSRPRLAADWPGGPRTIRGRCSSNAISPRTTRAPSRSAISPCSTYPPSRGITSAPMGTWHPPSSAPRKARSARMSVIVRPSFSSAVAARMRASSARICTAMAPCPGAGSQSGASSVAVIRCEMPRR